MTTYPIDVLHNILITVSKVEILNKDLFKTICADFSRKNINSSVVNLVFSQKININELSNAELMTLANAVKEELTRQELETKYDELIGIANSFKYLDLNEFFSEEDIKMWRDYKKEEKIIDKFEVKYFRKIDMFRYTGVLTYKELTLMLQNSIIIDNADTQRKSNIRMLGNGNNFIKEINTNQKNIDDMAKKILEGTFCPTEILINVPVSKGKKPQVYFEAYENDIMGTLRIKPNPDPNSKSETDLNLIDGRHRAFAIRKAYEEKMKLDGAELQGSITCQVFLKSIDSARDIVNQVFKRADDDTQWQESLKKSMYKDFINIILDNCNSLKDIPEIFEHCKSMNSKTYKAVLINIIKELNIDVADPSVITYETEAIGKFIDTLLASMNRNNIEMKYEDMVNLCGGYLVLAWELKDYKMKSDDWNCLGLLICEKINADLIRELKLNHKNYSVNNIINYFKSLASEVIKNGR